MTRYAGRKYTARDLLHLAAQITGREVEEIQAAILAVRELPDQTLTAITAWLRPIAEPIARGWWGWYSNSDELTRKAADALLSAAVASADGLPDRVVLRL